MKEYLKDFLQADGTFPLSWADELPLWSAPFGLKLLETIKMKLHSKTLDIGFGFGFPLIEVAMRMGEGSMMYGIDPWELAMEKTTEKINQYEIKNVEIVKGVAEELPFENDFFDLIISNNGLNNVSDIPKTLAECYRVAKHKAQFVFTMNLDTTMEEFYKVFKRVLKKNDMPIEIKKLNEHIYEKRKPLKEMKKWIRKAGFKTNNIMIDSFCYRFTNGTAMLNHFFIKYGFMDSWVKIIPFEKLQEIFEQVESGLNDISERKGELKITIPFATFDCEKKRMR